ncbi:MAG: hypothetical protein QXG39_03425 [Candidatus Aenigmatarchaeota archaeon]
MKARDLNELIERVAVFCDRFPKTKKYKNTVITVETDWYAAKFIQGYADNRWKIYAKVKNGEAFRMSKDDCCFCGLHSPVGGGHLFLGKRLNGGWFINRQGWISDKAKQICPNCKQRLSLSKSKEVKT